MSKIIELKTTDVLTMVDKCLHVNGKPFSVEYPTEELHDVEDNRLVTLFRGHLTNYWDVETVTGYYVTGTDL